MAKYFTAFPKIEYTYGSSLTASIDDITIRVDIIQNIIDELSNFEMYDVQDGETPEIIAYNSYNDSNLHWLVMLSNGILSRSDWPLTNLELETFIKAKYPNNTDQDPHHFEVEVEGKTYQSNSTSISINGDPQVASPVSNRTYETILNDDKRQIKLLRGEAIVDVYAELRRLVNNGSE